MALVEIIMEKRPPGAAWITLNRPQVLNCINTQMLLDFKEAVAHIRQDETIMAVVITGQGRAFSAGADLAAVKDFLNDPPQFRAFLRLWHEAFSAIENLDRPVIAAVNGYALAGGLELVLVCDLAIAAESALLGDAHANYGLIPGGGGSQRLPRLLGARRAKQLLYTGDFIPAREAERIGLVNQVAPDGELEEMTTELVSKIARKSLPGLRAMKMLVNRGLEASLAGGLEMEIWATMEHLGTADVREGLAAFAEKRPPVFKNR